MIVDLSQVDTTPGLDGYPFSPPAQWNGDEDAYRELMRQRYRDPQHAQRMRAIAWLAQHTQSYSRPALSFAGPHADTARTIVEAMVANGAL